jgi:ferredoxin
LGGARAVPLLKYLKSKDAPALAGGLVVVFPCYLLSIPWPVREFFNTADFASVECIAAISTSGREGNVCRSVIDGILGKRARALDYYRELRMPECSPTGIRPGKGDVEWIAKVEEAVGRGDFDYLDGRIGEIASDLSASKREPAGSEKPARRILGLLMGAMTKNVKTRLSFYSDATCTGCGLCEKLCPSGRIRARGKSVEWLREVRCYYCFGCFNACPEQAILLKNYALKTGRYMNRNVTAKDLMEQRGE